MSMDLRDVNRLDVVKTRIFGQQVLLPTVISHDGRTLPLLPIAWRFVNYQGTPAWTREQQTKVVHEIRDELGIGGNDLLQ
jgi:hypothetical protein